jgi:hypothetical protein
MQRLFLAGICLCFALSLGACADGGSVIGTYPVPSQSDDRGVGTSSSDQRTPTAALTGPLPDDADAACVEKYEPEALKRRAFAFDGVVLAVGPPVSDRGDGADLGGPGVTFRVREWFSGGSAYTVTVDLTSVSKPDTDQGDEIGGPYGIGSRLLVSGEARWGGSPLTSPIAWGCGFSRYYDQETATTWRDAIPG